MSPQTFDGIPGLLLYPRYFDADQRRRLIGESAELYRRLEAAGGGPAEKAVIPQPEFVRSAKHNLASEESYTRVALAEPDGAPLRAEYFPKYGEAGHALAYFRGNANMPAFVRDELIGPIGRDMVEAGLLQSPADALWKLTMNFYKSVDGVVAGFPFHVDIPANGVVTMILNFQREALFQIAKGDAVTDIRLPVGALLVLSGESRYQWKHRVLPMAAAGDGPAFDNIERVSLVLGFQ